MNNNLIEIYFSKKIFVIFLMGIASGIPLYMVLSTLLIWLTRENIEIATVGLFALTQIPWSLKFLWAPFVDTYKIPFLTKYLGMRKSWLLITQIFLIFSLIMLGLSEPNQNLALTAFFALLTAFFSANQDIIIDAFRIEILNDELQGAGAAATQFGYRFGGILAGAGSLYLKSIFTWSMVFLIISGIIFLLSICTIFLVRLDKVILKKKSKNLLAPFKEFILRNTIYRTLVIIFFIFSFKFGDVVAGIMANTPNPNFTVGGAVNSALENLCKALSKRGIQDNVNINVIHPGMTSTERLISIIQANANRENISFDQAKENALKASGLDRFSTPEEVAELTYFLCKENVRHINGTSITLDGGIKPTI